MEGKKEGRRERETERERERDRERGGGRERKRLTELYYLRIEVKAQITARQPVLER